MNAFSRLLAILLVTAVITGCRSSETDTPTSEWTPLFNGEDLTGWETWLSFQPEAADTTFLGLNNDPRGVFTVVDGTIRISGQDWGALTSEDAFENYHLRLDFKWGDKQWPPREEGARDSGLLYHCVAPHGAFAGNWMASHQLQIYEGDLGDYHSLSGHVIDAEARSDSLNGRAVLTYEEGAELHTGLQQRVVKSSDEERPHGEWNTIELIADGGEVTHIVNGVVVFRGSNSRRMVDGEVVPLTGGRIQIQSEGAELFLRNVEMRPLEG